MIGKSMMIEIEADIAAYVETVRMFDFQMEVEQCWWDNPVMAVAVDADCFDQMETDLDIGDIEMLVE